MGFSFPGYPTQTRTMPFKPALLRRSGMSDGDPRAQGDKLDNMLASARNNAAALGYALEEVVVRPLPPGSEDDPLHNFAHQAPQQHHDDQRRQAPHHQRSFQPRQHQQSHPHHGAQQQEQQLQSQPLPQLGLPMHADQPFPAQEFGSGPSQQPPRQSHFAEPTSSSLLPPPMQQSPTYQQQPGAGDGQKQYQAPHTGPQTFAYQPTAPPYHQQQWQQPLDQARYAPVLGEGQITPGQHTDYASNKSQEPASSVRVTSWDTPQYSRHDMPFQPPHYEAGHDQSASGAGTSSQYAPQGTFSASAPPSKRLRMHQYEPAESYGGPPQSQLSGLPESTLHASPMSRGAAASLLHPAAASASQSAIDKSLIARLRNFNPTSAGGGAGAAGGNYGPSLLLPPSALLGGQPHPGSGQQGMPHGFGSSPVSASVGAASPGVGPSTIGVAGGSGAANVAKAFACKFCPATFGRKDNQAKHVRAVHQGERPFQCELCGYRFQKKDHCEKHRRIVHFKERPYACPQDDCSSRFGQKSDLNKHFKTVHQKIKPYACPECGLTFGHRGNLLRHVGVVHRQEKKYTCEICNASFGERSNQIKHARAVHGANI